MFKYLSYIITRYLLLMLVISCKNNKTQIDIEWSIADTLPAVNNHPSIGVAGAVSGISNGKLIVAGGANFPNGYPWEGGIKRYHDDVYIFDIDENDSLRIAAIHKLPLPVAYAAIAQSGNSIIYAGGENAEGISDKVFRLTYLGDTLQIDSLPSLPGAFTNGSMSFYNNGLYFIGGEHADSTAASLWYFSFEDSNSRWEQLASVPHPVSHGMQMILSDKGKDYLYLFGGRSKNNNGISTIHKEVYAFDFTLNQWLQKKSLPHPLGAGVGVSVNNTAILVGGDNGIVFNKIEGLIARAAKLEGLEKDKVLNEKTGLQRDHSGFTRNVLLYNPELDEWSDGDTLPFDTPVTTNAVLHDQIIYITSGEIKPGVRTPRIIKGEIVNEKHIQ